MKVCSAVSGVVPDSAWVGALFEDCYLAELFFGEEVSDSTVNDGLRRDGEGMRGLLCGSEAAGACAYYCYTLDVHFGL